MDFTVYCGEEKYKFSSRLRFGQVEIRDIYDVSPMRLQNKTGKLDGCWMEPCQGVYEVQ